jgi:hypothetical protein
MSLHVEDVVNGGVDGDEAQVAAMVDRAVGSEVR